jgi:RimJ/RimL family protein N-acetyltransferase
MNNSLHVATTAALRPSSTEPIVCPDPWQESLPVLEGERVCLRELQRTDAAPLLPLISAPEVARFISPPPPSVERLESFIEWSRGQRAAGTYVAFALVPRGEKAASGLLQVRQLDEGFRTAEWGFALGAPLWGRGLFKEAARLLLDFAFGTLGVHRLEARAAVPNVRAHAVIQRLGAVREGVLRQSLVTGDGSCFDQVLWSLLDEDWRRLSAAPERHRVH